MSPADRLGQDEDLALELGKIRDQVRGLGILHGNPERFHLEKDQACRRLTAVIGRLQGRPADNTTWQSPEALRARAAKALAREAFKDARSRR